MVDEKLSPLQPPHVLVQAHLCAAISSERSKCWEKAIDEYEKLLKIVNNFSKNADLEPSYKQLDVNASTLLSVRREETTLLLWRNNSLTLYESHVHLGIAFQNVNQHAKAIIQFTKALQASSRRKKTCTVGCIYRSCLETPVLTRRAFARVKRGEMKEALRDAEAAISLDCSNPDVYCIRALVWNAMRAQGKAMKDLNCALRLNPSHGCSQILKSNTQKDLLTANSTSASLNTDSEKGFQTKCSPSKYSSIKDFNSPEILEFYNRYLWSLNVPHTVMVVRLPPADTSSQGTLTHLKRTTSADVRQINEETGISREVQGKPIFRCGTATLYPNKSGLLTRINYGKALRTQMTVIRRSTTGLRIYSAQETSAWLLGQESRTNYSFTPTQRIFNQGRHKSPVRMYEKPWKVNKLIQ